MDKTKQKKIHAGTTTITVYCNSGHSLQSLNKFVKNSVTATKEFFSDANIKKQNIQIELLCSRSEFDKALGKPTEDWLCGSIKKGTILIFHPNFLAKESSHKKKEFPQILTHEICHILIDQINHKSSWWLDEGVAQYIADQKPTQKIPPTDINYFIKHQLFKNSDYDTFISHSGYQISYMVTNLLIKKHGKNTVIELLKIKPGKHMQKKFLAIINEDINTFLRDIRKAVK